MMNRHKRRTCLLSIFLLFAVGIIGCKPGIVTRPDSNWWMFQTDLEHSGHLRGGGPTQPLVQKWESLLLSGDPYTSSLTPPVFGADRIFIGSGYGDSRLYALSPTDGTVLWSFQAPQNGFFGAPAAANGRVYAATLGSTPRVYALDAGTGSLVWETALSSGSRASIAVGFDKVFVNTDAHQLLALDQNNGSVQWTANTSPGGWSQESSPATGFGSVFVGSDDGLYAFDQSTGVQKWKYPVGDLVGFSSPVVLTDVGVGNPALVFISTNDRKLHAVNASNGSPGWTYTGSATMAFNSVAVADGKVFVFDFSSVVALDANAGTPVWTQPTNRVPRHSPAIAEGVLYYSDNEEIHGLDIADGTPLWSASIPGNGDQNGPGNALAIDKKLIVVPNSGSVYAFTTKGNTSPRPCISIERAGVFTVPLWPPVPVGCEVIDCCPGCPGPGWLDIRIHYAGQGMEDLLLEFRGMEQGSLKNVKIEGTGVWMNARTLRVAPGETILRAVRLKPRLPGDILTPAPEVLPMIRVQNGEVEAAKMSTPPSPQKGEEAGFTLSMDQLIGSHVVRRWHRTYPGLCAP